MIFSEIKTIDLDKDQLAEISAVKDTCWPHGIVSQIRWIKAHCAADDLHVLMHDFRGVLVGYATLSLIRARFDADDAVFLGLGSVCVARSMHGSGYGAELVHHVTQLIEDSTSSGLLLCKKPIVSFYRSCGWKPLMFDAAFVGGLSYSKCIMTTDEMIHEPHLIQIEKDF